MLTLRLGNLIFAAGHPSGLCLIINTTTGDIKRTDVAAMRRFIQQLIGGLS